MTSRPTSAAPAIRGVAVLVAFVLLGWGAGNLCTSVLAAPDLDAVRDIASSRAAPETLAAHVFSRIGSAWVVVPVALLVGVSMDRRGRRDAALAVALGTPGALVIADLDKLLVGRPRPPVHHLEPVAGSSFPSGHATQTAALVAALLLQRLAGPGPRALVLATAASLLVACVALSRVYLGVHYPSDVAAGVTLGVAWSVVAGRLVYRARQALPAAGTGDWPGASSV
jgi:membrane-associated phospholipid phosphatase